MPNITNTLSTVNGEANNIPVEWSQHTRLLLSLNVGGVTLENPVSSADFAVSSSVSTVEYEGKKLKEVSEPLNPQTAYVSPTIIDSGRPSQTYLSIPSNMYLEEVGYDTTTRPAVVADVLYTAPTGETDLIRFTIIVFRAKGSG